jgi:hypothetical protein
MAEQLTIQGVSTGDHDSLLEKLDGSASFKPAFKYGFARLVLIHRGSRSPAARALNADGRLLHCTACTNNTADNNLIPSADAQTVK